MTNFYKDFLQLTKFEIAALEILTLIAGYFIGHSLETPVIWPNFACAVIGTAFLAMAAGAINQIQERGEDAQMERTKNRPLPSGRISVSFAKILAFLLLLVGSLLLFQVSVTVFTLGWLAVLSYNVLYTMWWKRKHAFAAIPGAIPGALPILIGYQAALSETGAAHPLLQPGGYYLFAILFFWQMPHFWVLALKYSDDYDKGGFPTLPVAKGAAITREQITLWCLAYAGLGLLSPLFFPTGIIALVGQILVSIWLLFELWRFLRQPQQKTWLRFFLSINFSMMLYLGIIMADLLSIHLHPTS